MQTKLGWRYKLGKGGWWLTLQGRPVLETDTVRIVEKEGDSLLIAAFRDDAVIATKYVCQEIFSEDFELVQ